MTYICDAGDVEARIGEMFKDLWDIKDEGGEDMAHYEAQYQLIEETMFPVLDKCSYGEDLEVLSEQERTLFLSWELLMEMDNGGIAQYFINPSGDHAPMALLALRSIGETTLAELLERAMAELGTPYPADYDQRNADTDMFDQSHPRYAVWTACEDAFYGEYDGEPTQAYRDFVGRLYELIVNTPAVFPQAGQEN